MANNATTFYSLTTRIKDLLNEDPMVNEVTYGDLFKVALNKQTMYPLSHLMVNNTTIEDHTYVFNMSLICMDLLDQVKEDTTDIFNGNDNQMDIFNTQLAVVTRVVQMLKRVGLRDEGYELVGQPTVESFTDRFEDDVAGWVVTFDVRVIQDMEICG